MVKLAQEEKLQGYNFPQGVLAHLMRATASGDKGLLKKTGLNTFVDPRIEGGKINDITSEDIVEVVHRLDDGAFFDSRLNILSAMLPGCKCAIGLLTIASTSE